MISILFLTSLFSGLLHVMAAFNMNAGNGGMEGSAKNDSSNAKMDPKQVDYCVLDTIGRCARPNFHDVLVFLCMCDVW
jgi:hypothetical protein